MQKSIVFEAGRDALVQQKVRLPTQVKSSLMLELFARKIGIHPGLARLMSSGHLFKYDYTCILLAPSYEVSCSIHLQPTSLHRGEVLYNVHFVTMLHVVPNGNGRADRSIPLGAGWS